MRKVNSAEQTYLDIENDASIDRPKKLLFRSILEGRKSVLARIYGATAIVGLGLGFGGCESDKSEMVAPPGLSAPSVNQTPAPTVQPHKPKSEAPAPVEMRTEINKAKSTPIEPFAFTTNEYVGQMLELQAYWKQISVDALLRFEAADPQVQKIIMMLDEHAFYTIPVGPRITQYVGLGNASDIKHMQDPHAFEMVFMPEKFAKTMPAALMSENHGRTVRLATTFKTKEWLGIMLAHELSHVHDGVILGERHGAQMSPEWLGGEVKAHLQEMQNLEAWNPENYNILIEEGVKILRSGGPKNISAMAQLAKKLYPLDSRSGEVSPHEESLGMASCLIAIIFSDAMQLGATEENLREVYKKVLLQLGGQRR